MRGVGLVAAGRPVQLAGTWKMTLLLYRFSNRHYYAFASTISGSYTHFLRPMNRTISTCSPNSLSSDLDPGDKLLVVVGGGAAGIYGAIRAKIVAPSLRILVIEKGKPLSKVKISGGGRCNVTNGHFLDPAQRSEPLAIGLL